MCICDYAYHHADCSTTTHTRTFIPPYAPKRTSIRAPVLTRGVCCYQDVGGLGYGFTHFNHMAGP
eukprot:2262166-Rhodomonas_salina.1